ncbi:MAG: D-alanyl-D-alanine carboxypeptidase/D-alanyl-D-alanine-endopeptidase [Prolixibacteraceae bacterium]|jgi:D-alanyl-D-alanine carboxypeptidase/D-alanyl-D-alanine-endopeptidase (penicillin-binding protein 4)|nr:D-alanyl-D-alanine carboxypeptidase/D-alanyl-D-alanine-endopeptidase [Prolixibacteraceae bacterium]
MRILYTLTFTLLAISLTASEKNLEQRTSLFLNDDAIANAPVSIYVANTTTGEELFSVNPELSITPASVQKLITSATALEIMGADYSFSTKIVYKGTIQNNVLVGDLIILAGGDPSLGSPYLFDNKNEFLSQWANQIKKAGIDSISGNIIVNTSIFNDQDIPQTWIWEDLGNYFGAAAQSTALYDNTFEIVFETDNRNGGETRIIDINPEIPDLTIKNEVTASNDNRDRAYIYGSPFDSYRIIRGTLPKGRDNFSIKASVPNPALLLASKVLNILSDSSVNVGGKIQTSSLQSFKHIPDSLLLFEHHSPALSEIIKIMNHESVNLYAEHLCKHIGYLSTGDGSTETGTEVIKTFWRDKGIDTDWLFLADGSGLSRNNAFSAKVLTDILVYMSNYSSYFNDFEASIPLTGLQGTQKYYFQNSFLKGKARAKSGSMTRVRSFAGYMETQNGTPVAFSIIINNFNCGSFTMAYKMEKVIEAIYLEL